LADHRLLGPRGHLDRALAERVVPFARRPVDRAAIDADVFLAQSDLLLDRALDDIAPHPHAAAADFPLADPQPLLGDRDALLGGARPRPGRRGPRRHARRAERTGGARRGASGAGDRGGRRAERRRVVAPAPGGTPGASLVVAAGPSLVAPLAHAGVEIQRLG